MKYYGPDGTEYASLSEAQAAGVVNPTTIKPVAAPKPANIPTYGFELARLMQQYGVNSPTAPRTTDQSLIDQYFKKIQTPMYQTPTGNGLFDQYLNIGLGNIASPFGPMTRFFPGQAVAPAGSRYDPVTNTNVNVTDPSGVASAGRITTGTPNIGGNQCPPNFNFDPVTRSCVPTIDTGLLTGGKSQSEQQPMPTCPPNTTLDRVNRICIPKGCPAGYEEDASGNCVAKFVQTPCPPGFTRDESGVCIPPRVPECPPNTVKDQATGQCVPKSCPAGYEKDADGNCVAKSMEVPCPPGFSRDATGVCLPIITEQPCPSGSVRSYTGECVPVVAPPPPVVIPPPPPPPPTPCQSGYVRSATGECVPDPEQLAFFNKYYQSPQAGEYDIYNAMSKGNLSENLVRDLVSQRGGENVDEWLAKNVDPDKTFSAYAIQNLAAQGRPDDPNVANRGTQSGENRVFDLYQQGAIGLNEIEDAMGKSNVQDWMRANQPEEYARVYSRSDVGGDADFHKKIEQVYSPPPPVVTPPPVETIQTPKPVNQGMSDADVRRIFEDAYNKYGGAGVNAHRSLAETMNRLGISTQQMARVSGYTPEEVEADYRAFGYAKGGSVGLDGMMKKYQVGGSNRITDFNSMLGQAPAARPAMIGQPPMRDDGLNQMMQRYNVGRTSNSRQDYDQASERLKQAMMSASEASPVAAGPSKAEMYFRLASAFAKPTPTGNFFESLGNATGELAAYKGDVRAAESAAAQQRRDLAIELAKADVTRARDIMEIESESGRPLSPEGKSAYDEGLIPGTPEFAARKREIEEQNNLARLAAANATPTRMSTTEARAKFDAEREVLESEIAIDAINKAIELSETAYTKSVPDQILYEKAKITNPENERVVATQLMEQLVTTNLLSSLRSMFGGNVTEGERAIALATQGLESKSVAARDASFAELLGTATRRNTYLSGLIQRINSREFMQYEDFVAPESTELTAGQETGVI